MGTSWRSRSSCSAMRLPCCAVRSSDRLASLGSCPSRRVEPTARPPTLWQVFREAREPAPLAPGTGPVEMDAASPIGASEHPRQHGGDHPSTGPGEPHLALPPDPGRAGPDRCRPGSRERLDHPAPPRHRSLADAQRSDLERVPLPGVIVVGLRLLRRRHGAAQAALRGCSTSRSTLPRFA
jgi:hypothetical protein